jgi:glycosyltransferase involved in cell wall biosynthesis
LQATIPQRSRGPLVSIVVPTYNRRELLPEALRRLERQTYRNLEIVVVNDGGDPVDDIVKKFPRARLVDRPANGGIAEAENDGIRSASGEFIGFLADDDELFPDHVARLVDALLRSGAKIAHGNAINRLSEEDGRGGFRIYGYLVNYDGFLDRTEMQWCMNMILFSCLFHRRVLADVGGIDPGFQVANDYEFTLRASNRYDYVHVDYMTGAYNYRANAATQSNKSGRRLIDEVALAYERNPAPNRPLVAERRRITLEILEAGLQRGDYWPAPIRLEEGR